MNRYDPTTLHDYSTPPPKPPRKHRKLKIVAGLATIFTVALFVTAGLTSHPKTTNKVSAGTAQRAASQPAYTQSAPPQPPTCTQQLITWRNNGGQKNNTALGDADTKLSGDASKYSTDLTENTSTTADADTLAADAGSILGVTTLIKENMPPSCVPGLDTDYGHAVNDEQLAANYITESIGALNRGNAVTAVEDMALADASLNDGVTAVEAATTDLSNFNS